MKNLISLCVLFISLGAYSQGIAPTSKIFGPLTPIDFEMIASNIADPSSQFYYPRLMKRYEKNDTTLTFDQYFHLYFGYPEQPNYKPLLRTNYADSLTNAINNQFGISDYELLKMERYAKAVLSVEPFNLREINVLIYVYQNLALNDQAVLQVHKLNGIMSVIQASGTGLTVEYPWHIIYADHAEDLLNLFRYEPGRIISVTKFVKFIACKTPYDKNVEGYYFDYSEIYKRKPTYLDQVDAPKRKLDINPTPKDI